MHNEKDELILVKLRIHKSQYPELHHSVASVDKRKRATIIKRLAETGAAVTSRHLTVSLQKGGTLSKQGQDFSNAGDIKVGATNIDNFHISFDPDLLTKTN